MTMSGLITICYITYRRSRLHPPWIHWVPWLALKNFQIRQQQERIWVFPLKLISHPPSTVEPSPSTHSTYTLNPPFTRNTHSLKSANGRGNCTWVRKSKSHSSPSRCSSFHPHHRYSGHCIFPHKQIIFDHLDNHMTLHFICMYALLLPFFF